MTTHSHRQARGACNALSPLGPRSGQGLIESCLVVALVCLIFFGIFQISQLFAAQEILDYAAGRGARARSVGFNHFMVFKTIRVGAIANAGRLVNPAYQGGPAQEHAIETARIPLYLGGENGGMLNSILSYEAWDTLSVGSFTSLADGSLQETVTQDVPLKYPFHKAFYAADSVALGGTNTMDQHYTLYLDDQNW